MVMTLMRRTLQGNIEKIVVTIVNDILKGNGFSFTMPTRSASNQLYVPELDRIVLKDKTIVRDFARSKTIAFPWFNLVLCILIAEMHRT